MKFFAAIIILLFSFSCSVKNAPARTDGPVVSSPEQKIPSVKKDSVKIPRYIPFKDSFAAATISLAGDLMCHITQYTYAKTKDGKYDFNPSFAEVKKYLSAADLAIGNLETTFAGAEKGYSGYPNFNTPDEYAEALKNAGFDLLVMSNNHSMDTEEKGLLRTIEVVEKNKFHRTGTYVSQRDRDSVRIFNLNGIRLGVLNYTYGTNFLLPSKGKEYMLNLIDTALIKSDISVARKQGAEAVLVYFHFGPEYHTEPSEYQKQVVAKTIEYGADIIIGAHTHVLQPMEFYKTQNAMLDTGFIAWSLGNFISNQKDRYCDAGVILNLMLEKNVTKNKIRIAEASYIPTWVYRGTSEKKKIHIIFPSEFCTADSVQAKGCLPDFIDTYSKAKMKQAYEDANAIINKRESIRMKNVIKR